MTDASATSERGRKDASPSPGPIAGRPVWPVLARLAVAIVPLVGVVALDATLGLADVAVGAGALLSILLVVAISLVSLPRLVRQDATPAPSEMEAASGEAGADAGAPGPHDPLTGLPTFQPFSQRLLEEYHRTKRLGGSMAVVLLDVNHLAQVNDQFGSETGDKILQDIANTLLDSKRVSDVAARMGDDEFGVLLLDCSEAGARAFVERVHEHLDRESIPVEADGHITSVWIGICAGIGVCNTATADADAVLTAAVDDLNESRAARDRRRDRWEKSA